MTAAKALPSAYRIFAGDTPSIRSDATGLPALSTMIAAITTLRSRAYAIAPSMIARASAREIEGGGNLEAGAGIGAGAAARATDVASSMKTDTVSTRDESVRIM